MELAHRKFLLPHGTIRIGDHKANIGTVRVTTATLFVSGDRDYWLESEDDIRTTTIFGVRSLRIRNKANKTMLSLTLKRGFVVVERK
jgi:hypothetical protein